MKITITRSFGSGVPVIGCPFNLQLRQQAEGSSLNPRFYIRGCLDRGNILFLDINQPSDAFRPGEINHFVFSLEFFPDTGLVANVTVNGQVASGESRRFFSCFFFSQIRSYLTTTPPTHFSTTQHDPLKMSSGFMLGFPSPRGWTPSFSLLLFRDQNDYSSDSWQGCLFQLSLYTHLLTPEEILAASTAGLLLNSLPVLWNVTVSVFQDGFPISPPQPPEVQRALLTD